MAGYAGSYVISSIAVNGIVYQRMKLNKFGASSNTKIDNTWGLCNSVPFKRKIIE